MAATATGTDQAIHVGSAGPRSKNGNGFHKNGGAGAATAVGFHRRGIASASGSHRQHSDAVRCLDQRYIVAQPPPMIGVDRDTESVVAEHGVILISSVTIELARRSLKRDSNAAYGAG